MDGVVAGQPALEDVVEINEGLAVKKDIDFKVDEDIYEKTGVKRPRKGEGLSGPEAEKIYRHQIEQDLVTLVKFNGINADQKREEYDKARYENDLTYRTMSDRKPLGAIGKLAEVTSVIKELSWRDTNTLTKEIYGIHLTKPPIIAHKRYQEWLSGKPQGPSKQYLYDKAQRRQDAELWDNIKSARLEKTRTEIRAAEIRQSNTQKDKLLKEKADAKAKKKNKGVDPNSGAGARRLEKQKFIQENNFDSLRLKPTNAQSRTSMRDWDKGHKDDWDFDKKGFAPISQTFSVLSPGKRMSHNMVLESDLHCYEGPEFSVDQ